MLQIFPNRVWKKRKVMTKFLNHLIEDLGKVGIITEENIKKHYYFGILKDGETKKYLTSVSIKINDKERIPCYTLNKKGRAFFKKNIDNLHIYVSTKQQYLHDKRLSDYYFQLSRTEQMSWMPESSLKDRFLDEKYSVDAAYYSEGNLIAVESIGKSYTEQTIEKKIKYAKEIGATKLIKLR